MDENEANVHDRIRKFVPLKRVVKVMKLWVRTECASKKSQFMCFEMCAKVCAIYFLKDIRQSNQKSCFNVRKCNPNLASPE